VEETAVWSPLKRAVVQPRNESRPDLEIIFDLAQRLLLANTALMAISKRPGIIILSHPV
jgi:anaerobic selenocysteine-containing dehydrogenase